MQNNHFSDQLNYIKHLVHSDCVGLAKEVYCDVEGLIIKWLYFTGASNNKYKSIALSHGKGIAGSVYKTAATWMVEDVDDTLNSVEKLQHPILISEKIKAFVAIPLFKGTKVNGVIFIGYRNATTIDLSLVESALKDTVFKNSLEIGGSVIG